MCKGQNGSGAQAQKRSRECLSCLVEDKTLEAKLACGTSDRTVGAIAQINGTVPCMLNVEYLCPGKGGGG